MAKQHLVAEIYYSGAWHEVPVYVRDPVQIVRGRPAEATQLAPSTATLTIDDRTQQYNPRNPASDLYGLIGRNTPIRSALRPGATTGALADAADTWTRTVVDGWGSADVGGAWSAVTTVGGTAAWFQVNGGVGRHDVQNANAYAASYLSAIAAVDVDQTVTVTAPAATGADLETGLMARGTSINDYVLGRAHLATDGTVTAKIYSADDTLLGSAVVSGLTHAGQALTVRMRTVGRDVFVRVWEAAGVEPSAWDLHVVDTTTTPVAGWIGIRSGREVGNTNTTGPQFAYDNYSVTVDDPRCFGEVASWKPRRTVDFDQATGRGNAWVEVEAAGILRRLGQGAAPLRSAVRRVTETAPSLDAYWPMEDAQNATELACVTLGSVPARWTGTVTPAGRDDLLGSAPLPTMSSGARIGASVGAATDTGEWAVALFVYLPTNVSSDTTIFRIDTVGEVASWRLVISNGAPDTMYLRAYNGAGVEIPPDLAEIPAQVSYNEWMFVRVKVVDNTTFQSWQFAIVTADGTGIGHSNVVTAGGGTVRGWSVTATANLADAAYGHVAVFSDTGISYLADTYRAITGWSGETAGRRIERLCTENDVPFSAAGDLDTTMPMGPQRVDTLTALLAECERTDDGMLADPAGWLGLHYRTRESLYNQTAALTLDYDAGHVAPPLEPEVDDLAVANDVTATRPDGSSARAVQETGPLNVSSPADDPDGIGRVKTRVDVNPADVADLPDLAAWHLAKGTVDETRYPRITVDLDANPALAADAAATNPGDMLTVDNLEPDQVRQVVGQLAETIGSHRRLITYVGSPASPYDIGVYDDAGSRFDSAYSTTAASFVAGTDTSLSVAVEAGRLLWVTGSGAPQFPLNVRVHGVVLEVTAITGTSSPQTFTVTQTPVNGVTKTIPAGKPVRLAAPVRYGL